MITEGAGELPTEAGVFFSELPVSFEGHREPVTQ
jgi:hypothetical protein